MPYVPPHKRVPTGDDGHRPRPEAMHSSSKSRSSLRPKVDIKIAPGAIRRFSVLSRPGSQVRFEPFLGTSYSHLDGRALYTAENVDPETSLVFKEQNAQLREQFVDDIGSVMVAVRSYVEGRKMEQLHVRVKLVLRFGKTIFHSPRASLAKEVSTFGCFGELGDSSRWSRTFDTALPVDEFKTIEKQILQDARKVDHKDRFVIEVTDKNDKNCTFKCKCVRPNSGNLQIKSVKSKPMRHMVHDALCLGKKHDLRLILLTDTYLNLSDDEMSNLNHLVNTAVVDDTVKGGLHWPLGSSANRFKVDSVFNLRRTIVHTKGSKTWKFIVARRAEFDGYTERVSYEAEFKDSNITDFVDCEKDTLMQLCNSTMDTAETCI